MDTKEPWCNGNEKNKMQFGVYVRSERIIIPIEINLHSAMWVYQSLRLHDAIHDLLHTSI